MLSPFNSSGSQQPEHCIVQLGYHPLALVLPELRLTVRTWTTLGRDTAHLATPSYTAFSHRLPFLILPTNCKLHATHSLASVHLGYGP